MARSGTSGGCSADISARTWLPDYRSCGRPVPTRIQELLQIACDLNREHPARGAGLIRLQLRKHVHEGGLPSIRSLQLAFAGPESIGRGTAAGPLSWSPQNGELVKQFPANELTRERIIALAVSRRR